jgi:glycolate oxidase FAD binding subunit
VNGGPLSTLKAQLAAAYRDRRTIAIEGARTKHGWGSPAPAADVTISTRGLDAVVEHRYGDLTATVQAGAPLAGVNRELARHGQWIALDPPWADRATIGGILATNDSGPRRHRFGAPRDNIIGIDLLRVDGTAAKAGGIVVKNVAGYDLGRLMTGSFGSLAVIASATFKLYPIPPASRTVLVDCGDRSAAVSAERVVAALASSQLTPTAIELQTHPTRLLVRFESIEAAAEQQASQAVRVAQANGGRAAIVAGPDEGALWETHAQRPWSGPGAVLKVTLLPAELGTTLSWLDETLGGVDWEAIGRAAACVLLVRVDGEPARQAKIVGDLRARFQPGRGSVVVVRASDELKRAAGVWGAPGDALPIMRAVKQQFDPHGLLNPGRGPFDL